MARKFNLKSKSTWKKVGIIALAGVLLVGAIAGISALFRKSEETTKVINPSYAVGGLTQAGKYFDTEESIYTKNAFDCQGLDIDIDFESSISYKIYFYDGNDEFLSTSETLTSNYSEPPISAKSCRIVITPLDDSKVSWYEISKYSNQLNIRVNKEQNYRENLFVNNSANVGFWYGLTETDSLELVEASGGNFSSSFIDVSKYTSLTIGVPFCLDSEEWNCTFGYFGNDIDNTRISQIRFDGASVQGDYEWYTINIPDGATKFSINYSALTEDYLCVYGNV